MIMKKSIIIFMAAASAVFASCTKEVAKDNQLSDNLVPKTFTAVRPETKTTIDGTSVKWAADDKIAIIGVTDEDVVTIHEFTINTGVNTGSATFTGTVSADETSFYALYPYSATINLEDGNKPFSGGDITVKSALPTPINAVAGTVDPRWALMTAVADSDGKLAFRHGVSYIKFEIAVDDVASITFDFPNKVGGRPSYNKDSGALTYTQGNKSSLTIAPEVGTFTKGDTYYLPLFSTKKFAATTITFEHSNGSTVVKTLEGSALADVVPALGCVYNIGCPPLDFSPVINPVTPSKLDASATAGSFTYTVVNPDGVSVVSAVKKSGDWITSVDDSVDGTISFTCTANTGEERTGVITLSYTGADDVDVTITQKALGGGAEEHERVIYVSSGSIVQELDGVEGGSYFTLSGSLSTYGASFHADFGLSTGVVIDGTNYASGIKFNSGAYVRFTTSSTLNTKVSYYSVRRKTGDTTASIKITKTGGSALRSDSVSYGEVTEVENVSLEKGAEYTIERDAAKEISLVLVVINETE